MKKILVIPLLLLSLLFMSCNECKIERIHIISENKCYIVNTGITYAKYYIYVNGNRYRRNDVIEIAEGDKCPYCLEQEIEVDE